MKKNCLFGNHFYGYNIWCIFLFFTMTQKEFVYAIKDCTSLPSIFKVSIPDKPVQKNTTVLETIEILSNASFNLEIGDPVLKNAIEIKKDPNTKNWQLNLIKPIDLDAKRYKDSAQWTLWCHDENDIKTDLMFEFNYSNTYPPSFNQRNYTEYLDESTPINKTVFKTHEKISDEDFWPYFKNFFKYSLEPNNTVFDIEPNDGNVILKEPLDYESKNKYFSFTLFVKDLGNNMQENWGQTINTTLEFVVKNVDDNSPKFTQNIFNVDIFENATANSVYEIKPRPEAFDKDDMGEQILYEILDKPPTFDNYFEFDPQKMVIKVKKMLDQFPSSTIKLRIKAYQADRPSDRFDTGFLVINIFSINKHPPKMVESSYETSIKENVFLPSILLQVKALDEDGNTLEYRMGPKLPGIFLNRTTGIIKLEKLEQYKGKIKFQVWAEEINTASKQKSQNSTVTINIIDVNDHNPVFSQRYYNFILNQTDPEGTTVGEVFVTDEDPALNGEIVYELVDTSSIFAIDNQGIIRTNASLVNKKPERYIFMVNASDKALIHPRSASAFVEVTVHKENIFPPKFSKDMPSKIEIKESVPKDTNILEISATDEDDLDSLSFSVYPNDTFGIKTSPDSHCSFLYLRKEVDTETKSSYELNITVTDSIFSALHVLHVKIIGVNDMYPMFKESIYNFYHREESKIRRIGKVTATDKDINPSQVISYSLLKNSNFQINASTGEITALRIFQILEPTYFSFAVFATDGGSPKALNTSCLVNIHIVDINNHVPEFALPSIQLVVQEDKMKDPIYHLEATDKDLDPKYKMVSYGLTNSNYFELRNKSYLYVRDGEEENILGKSVFVIVETFDTDRPQKKNQINITVTFKDINNKVPFFKKLLYQKDVLENKPVGTEILKVEAEDDDATEENRETKFSIVYLDPENPFLINSNTGVISIRKPLDADGPQNKTFSFQVRVENTRKMDIPINGQTFNDTQVEITVMNVNDNSPEFHQNVYIFPINETVAIRQPLFNITAIDKDNDEVFYSLAGNYFPFVINATTGEISVLQKLDFKKKLIYTFLVSANDTENSALVDVVIPLERKSNKPPIVNDKMAFSILEEMPKGTFVGYIQALDIDEDQLNYSTDSKEFSINSTTGELKSEIVFDYENITQYHIIVTVSDNLHLKKINVTIYIIDLNDNVPHFSKSEYQTNLTNFENGTIVIQISATNGDTADKIMDYRLTGDSDFKILPNGNIQLKRTLDWKSKRNSIALVASAFDSKNNSAFVPVIITLIKPMEFSKSKFTTSVFEDAQVGTNVFQIEPCDFVDRTVSIQNLNLKLLNNNFLEFDKNCMCLRTKAKFDRETMPFHQVTMELKDVHGTHQANLSITVKDVNDEPPIFKNVTEVIELADDTEPGTFVIKMDAIDEDETNDGFTFFLKETYGKFTIDSNNGMVITSGRFNYNLDPQYNLSVFVIDHGLHPHESNQTLYIRITDSNRYEPTFNKPKYIFNINESSSEGYVIGQLNASDNDTGANGYLIFEILEGNENYTFAIDKSNGTVWVNNSYMLDYELIKQFNLTVAVRDSGTNPKSSSAILLVNLDDINDNYPEFSSSKFFSKKLPILKDQQVFKINAMDGDSINNGYNKIQYFQLNLNKIFYTDSSTGVVRSKAKLTNTMTYSLNFQACDMGGNCRNQSDVKLSVYSEIPNTVFVEEGLQNAFVIDINATDGDSGVSYSLISCHEYFKINSSTGIIKTQKPLVWYPGNNIIPISIIIHHTGQESNYTKKEIIVKVVNVNNHVPEFSQRNYQFQIAENAEDTFDISAFDLDDVENEILTYKFLFSEPKVSYGNISLNETTGKLHVNSLDREDHSQHTFKIMVMDNGNPRKSSTATVTLQVLDVNDNKPIFTKMEYKAEINETSQFQKVITVHANDLDDGLNGTVHYKLENSSVPFIIDPINGDIWSIEGLEFEKKSMYKLQIWAIDQDIIAPQRSNCSVFIHVINVCNEVPNLTTIIPISKDILTGVSIFSLKSSENGTNYNITAENNLLGINSQTGNVFTTSTIPKTTTTNYQVTLTAWNHCNFPVNQKFELKPVEPLPKQEMESLKAEITENACSNNSIFNLSSIEEFQKSNVTFQLRSFTEFFKIENDQIFCENQVDREQYSEMILFIDVTINDIPISYTTGKKTLKIVVTVKDVNDNPPKFKTTDLFYSLPSTAQYFYQIAVIKAIDKDAGENGTCQFGLDGKDKDLFFINPSSGALHSLFDASAKSVNSEFNLVAVAVDQNGKGLTVKAPLKISIYDPQFNLEMIVNKPVEFVEKILNSFIQNLSQIIGFEIIVDQVQIHRNSVQNFDLEKSNILFHVLDLENKKLVSKQPVSRKMKEKKALIEALLSQYGISTGPVERVVMKKAKTRTEHKISNSEMIIIILGCIIFLGCIFGILMAFIMTRRQQKKLRTLKASMKANSNFLHAHTNRAFDSISEASNYEILSGSHVSGRTSSVDSNYNSIRSDSHSISVISDNTSTIQFSNGKLVNESNVDNHHTSEDKLSLPEDGGTRSNHSKVESTSLSKNEAKNIVSSSDENKETSESNELVDNKDSKAVLVTSTSTSNSQRIQNHHPLTDTNAEGANLGLKLELKDEKHCEVIATSSVAINNSQAIEQDRIINNNKSDIPVSTNEQHHVVPVLDENYMCNVVPQTGDKNLKINKNNLTNDHHLLQVSPNLISQSTHSDDDGDNYYYYDDDDDDDITNL